LSISAEGTVKNHLRLLQDSTGDASVLTQSFFWEIFDQNWPVCRSIVVKEKPNVGSPFFVVRLSDHIPKATKDVNVHFFTHSSNSCKLYQQIPGKFWSYVCKYKKYYVDRKLFCLRKSEVIL